jgi:hypothetical protein
VIDGAEESCFSGRRSISLRFLLRSNRRRWHLAVTALIESHLADDFLARRMFFDGTSLSKHSVTTSCSEVANPSAVLTGAVNRTESRSLVSSSAWLSRLKSRLANWMTGGGGQRDYRVAVIRL